MSEASKTTTATEKKEPVQVTNVYDNTQLKHALDDELCKFIENECGYIQSHQHTDVKLVLGYISCAIAAGSFFYEKKHGFESCQWGTLGCCIAFWILQSGSWLYTKFIQKNEAFVGYIYHDKEKIKDHAATLSVTTFLDQYSSDYKMEYLYTDEKTHKLTRLESIKPVNTYFKEDGTLVEGKLYTDIKSSIDSLPVSLHKN
ncbi:unnamed protein product [Cunninghamella blakesleeana]